MSDKRISIITVCFNAETDIEKTILSVLSQTYRDIEYIVIDGKSTDNTVNLIKKYENQLTYWNSEKDRGIYDAMNKGIDIATGDWILFMNAGDVFHSNNVVQQIFSQKYSEDIGIIYGDVELDFGITGKMIRSLKSFNNNDCVITELCHQGVLTKASVLKELKYDLNFRIMSDINSFVQIHKKGYKHQYVPIVFSTFEATKGVSATKPFVSLVESCKIQHVKKISMRYAKSLTKALCKYTLLKFLPCKLYNKIRFRHLQSIMQYK